MSQLWTAQQQQWLQAMGHQVWTLGGAQSVEAAAEHAPAHAPRDRSLREESLREAAALLKGESAPQARNATRAPAPDRLMAAVFRAAGRNSGDDAVAVLVPDIAALRGNAAAKRALWPNLRALRRRGGAA
ncbi:MAG TPA: alanine acetyltransferase [Lysobacter sp.]